MIFSTNMAASFSFSCYMNLVLHIKTILKSLLLNGQLSVLLNQDKIKSSGVKYLYPCEHDIEP